MVERATPSLIELIALGRLKRGTVLYHKARVRHPERNVTATVTDGGLMVGGRVFSTPSAAARFITKKPVDGWMFWRLPSGEALGSLRIKSSS